MWTLLALSAAAAALPGEHVAGPASAAGELLIAAPAPGPADLLAPGCFSVDIDGTGEGGSTTVCPVTGTANPDNHKCLLTIPGQGNNYDGFSVFMSVAASVGYASFSIQYKAAPSTYSICYNKYDDLDCGQKVREAKQKGGDNEYIKVAASESVEARVQSTLMFLAGKAGPKPPADAGKPERWAECLNADNTPKWDSVAVMGASEGAGTAAYVGYSRKVARVMQFSGIDDAVNYNLAAGNYSPPLWVDSVGNPWAGVTPLDGYYGFGEVYDAACRAWRMNFERFPMPGKFINVNLIKNSNYGDRVHKFCSDRTHSSEGHLTTVWDLFTPKDAEGNYIYLPVWLAMLGHPVGTLSPAAVDAVGPFRLGKPVPIASPSPVLVQHCDDYKSIKQRWEHSDSTKVVSLVDTEPDRKLVLDCGDCAAGREVRVVTLGTAPKSSQRWEYARGRFIHGATGLCLARAPEQEAGLVLLRTCGDAAPEDIKWTIATSTRHITSDDVCLSVKHLNTTRCQCVF